MAIVTANELNTKFSNIVNDYISKGYNVRPLDTDQVILIKPNHKNGRDYVYGVLLETDDVTLADNGNIRATVANITVKKYSCIRNEYLLLSSEVYSNDNIVFSATYYRIPTNRSYIYDSHIRVDSVYTDDIKEYEAMYNLHTARYRDHHNGFNDDRLAYPCRYINKKSLTSKFIDNIMCRINNIKGFKRAHADCIDSIMLHNCGLNDINHKMYAEVNIKFNNKQLVLNINR